MPKVIITVDLEQDISKYLRNSYRGVSKGIPKVLDKFELFKIKANFFITANVCLRYPDMIKQIIDKGHKVGSHSYDHSIAYLGRESFKKQLNDLSAASDKLKKVTGCSPMLFRAPNFSINGDTIKALEKLGYRIDSSILPGRRVKKWGMFTLLDYTGVTAEIYKPSYSDARISGESKILEVPLTENPLVKGSPLGLGFLNAYGLEKTIEAVNNVKSDYIMFLIHPWETVDLGKYYPKLKPWLHSACSSDMAQLHRFLEYAGKRYTFSTIEDIISNYQNKSIL